MEFGFILLAAVVILAFKGIRIVPQGEEWVAERLGKFAESEDIPYVDVAEPMQQAADRDHIFFHGFGKGIGNGHWNEAGHRFAGELFAAKISEEIAK